MEYSKQDRQKLNGEGILANREAIIKLRQINMGVHCGFVHCDTCPFHRNNSDATCGSVAIHKILDELILDELIY